MKTKSYYLFSVILFSIITTACTSTHDSEQFQQLLEKAPNEPKTIEDIMQYPNGILANLTFEADRKEIMDEIQAIMPQIKEEKDEAFLEEWWRVYHSLFAGDYPDPRRIFIEKEVEAFEHPAMEEERYRMKEHINVLIVLDVSGSMGSLIDGKTMIDIAKESIQSFLSELPKEAHVGLRVYGHRGGTEEKSCASTELVYDIQAFQKEAFEAEIERYEPTGHTPLARSIMEAKEDFEDLPGENNTNLIYVVSDGLETCGGDPVAAAESLSSSTIQPIINVIGFDVDNESQVQLQEISKAGKGTYTRVGNEEELNEAFQEMEEMMRLWEEWQTRTKEEATIHRNEQLQSVHDFNEEWAKVNNKERINLFYPLNELRSAGYITEEAHSYFAAKRSNRFQDYVQLREALSNELMNKINNNYQDVMEITGQSFKGQIGTIE